MKNKDPSAASETSPDGPEQDKLVVRIDYDKFFGFLDDAEIGEENKREMLRLLWGIVCDFVALGYGVHPVEQALKSCGKVSKSSVKPTLAATNKVELKEGNITKSFEDAAEPDAGPAAGGFET